MDDFARRIVIVCGMPANTIPRIHLFHHWTRWSAPETVVYRMPRVRAAGEAPDDQYLTFTRDEQTRSCAVCGAEQVREVKVEQRHAS
jgi:hypothetical protein